MGGLIMGKLRKMLGVAAGSAALGTTALLAMPATAQAAPTPCSANADACIDLSANTSWLMDDNGAVIYGGVPITSGRPGYETPPGTFQVTYKDIDHWSQAYDAPMPYSVFFTTSGIAFHEGDPNVQSHGCVHLGPQESLVFYDNLFAGEQVQVVA